MIPTRDGRALLTYSAACGGVGYSATVPSRLGRGWPQCHCRLRRDVALTLWRRLPAPAGSSRHGGSRPPDGKLPDQGTGLGAGPGLVNPRLYCFAESMTLGVPGVIPTTSDDFLIVV